MSSPAAAHARIASLDGLRGFAFLMIFVVHLQLPAAFVAAHPFVNDVKEGGWIAVPIFFVLSGYLITDLVLREGPRFALLRFYARRALRLWPLHFTAAALALLAWQSPILRETRVAAAPEWAAPLLTFTLNIAARAQWAPFGTLGVMALFWTLAIEEQFYALWGLVLRFCSARVVRTVCVAIIVASLGVRFVLPFERAFLFQRMHSLVGFGSIMLGCGLALIGIERWRLSPAASNVALLALIATALAISVFGWPLPTTTVGGGVLITIVDAFCAAVLVVARRGTGWVRALLQARALRTIGALSYGAYVVHLAVLWFYYGAIRPKLPFESLVFDFGACFVATMALARGWYAVEAPFRRARVAMGSRTVQDASVSPWRTASPNDAT